MAMNEKARMPKGRMTGRSASAGFRKLKGSRFVLHKGQEGYPEAFMKVMDPPACIYGIGNPKALQEGLAVIGARKATPYGLACARKFAGRAASKGVVIVSGGAYGCDSAAHQAALENGGITVCILGGGCDMPYPQRNFQLFQSIVDKDGAVISEHSWDEPPLPYRFRLRNRLIAGLAKATLIVEAGAKSGTFSTADEALAANRDVLVVPGPINSANSLGSNRLIRQGATPIVDEESFDDALFWLYGALREPSAETPSESAECDGGTPETKAILRMLHGAPARLPEICSMLSDLELESSETETLLALSVLEIEGLVSRYPDGRYGAAVR